MTLFATSITLLILLLLSYDLVHQRRKQPSGVWFSMLLTVVVSSSIAVYCALIFGLEWCFQFALVALVIPYLAETIGVATGYPFGRYRYHRKAAPFLAFGVPVAVAIIWIAVLMFAMMEVTLLYTLLFDEMPSLLAMSITVGLIATLTDLIIEPVMTRADYWQWDVQASYLRKFSYDGVPFSNYLGWFLTSSITVFVALKLGGMPTHFVTTGALAMPVLWAGVALLYTAILIPVVRTKCAVLALLAFSIVYYSMR